MTLRERLWLLVSQAINALFFGGDVDESLSARAWRQRNEGWSKAHARIDSWLGAGHCYRVRDAQLKREQARNAKATF